jgi:hypothetical protein
VPADAVGPALKKLFTRIMLLDKAALKTQFELLFARLKKEGAGSGGEAKESKAVERKDGAIVPYVNATLVA